MKSLSIALCFCLFSGGLQAADAPVLKEKKDRTSYSMGYNIGNAWKRQGMEPGDITLEVLISGIRDSMGGAPALVPESENRDIMMAFQNDLKTRREEKRKVLGEKNKVEGETFLTENKSKPGIHTTASGLQYKVVSEGSGPKPTTNDLVNVNYRGTFIDGTEFDSSAKHGNQPATMRVNGVIKGWSEALQMMPSGSKWQLFIPADLAYAERGTPSIAPNAALIFDIELVGIKAPEKPQAAAPAQLPVTSDIIKVPSAEELKKGAKIEIIKPDQIEKEKEKEKK